MSVTHTKSHTHTHRESETHKSHPLISSCDGYGCSNVGVIKRMKSVKSYTCVLLICDASEVSGSVPTVIKRGHFGHLLRPMYLEKLGRQSKLNIGLVAGVPTGVPTGVPAIDPLRDPA